jgi:hypothetical protein
LELLQQYGILELSQQYGILELSQQYDIYFTEFGTALTTILPILSQYCYKYCYSDSRNL